MPFKDPQKRKEYLKKYREDNKEKIKESFKKTYEKNKEKYNEKNRERSKKYYYENIITERERTKKYGSENKEKIKEYQKDWYKKNYEKIKDKRNLYIKQWCDKNKEKIKEYQKNWKENNKEYEKNWRSEKRKTNPLFKLKENISRGIRSSLTKKGYSKRSRTYEILGCTYDEFKTHLEGLFEPWMSWLNYGLYNGELNYGWDIDHIIPISLALTEDDVLRLNHYTNLKPLCSKVNRDIKRNNPNF